MYGISYRRYTHPLVTICVCLFHCDNIKLIKPSMFSGAGTPGRSGLGEARMESQLVAADCELRDDYFESSNFKVRELWALWALESCWCQSNGEIWRNNMFQPLLHRFDHGCSQWFRNLQQSSWVALLRMLLAAPTQQLFVRPCHFVSNLFHILCQDQSKCLASFWDYRRYTHPLV